MQIGRMLGTAGDPGMASMGRVAQDLRGVWLLWLKIVGLILLAGLFALVVVGVALLVEAIWGDSGWALMVQMAIVVVSVIWLAWWANR
jgi:hypothetical protein